MSDLPVLSLVIPSRNRAEYAQHCLRALAQIRDPGLEVIFEDNSATDAIGRWLERELPDPRIRYAHSAESRTLTDNFDAGMRRATGTFVALLGDDDGVNPELLEAARWADRHDVDALVPHRIAQYNWPDVQYRYYGSRFAGVCAVSAFTGRVTRPDIAAGVRDAARAAFQTIVDSVTLPKLYYGLVRRSCLEQMRQETGTYFPGVSPDMAAAIGVTAYLRSLVAIDYPLFVPGTSARSAAGASAQKRHVGRLEDQPQMPRNFREQWPPTVPMLYTVQTVWAQAGVRALEVTGRAELVRREYDMGYLHAACAVLNPSVAGEVMRSYRTALRHTGTPAWRGIAQFGRGFARVWLLRAWYLRRRLGGKGAEKGTTEFRECTTIADAVEAVTAHLNARGEHVSIYLRDR